MKENTKTYKVLNHLRTKGSITSLEAYELYHVTRLAAIIFNLKKLYDIQSEKIVFIENGRASCYAKYKLAE